MSTNTTTPPQHTQLSTLDFRDNTPLVLVSYLLRAIGAVIFGALFTLTAQQFHPDAALTVKELVTIAIAGVPGVVSIALIAAAVIGVLWLHELVHASVFFVHTGAPPRIGIRGPIIFASAEGYLNARNAMIVNALAPFAVISALGLVLLAVVPVAALAWVFIPTVANAAAAGGDFMAVIWLVRLPGRAQIADHGDLLIAYGAAA